MTDRALQILFDAYWAQGMVRWEAPVVSPEDFAFARDAGVMFDPLALSHAEVLEWVRISLQLVSREAVAAAFLASLSSRRLELRSALGSYAVGRQFPHHDYRDESGFCAVCGFWGEDSRPRDLSVLNFERFKWGGVRHAAPEYIALDLMLFSKLEPPAPSAEDRRILRAILDAAQGCGAGAKPRDLEKRLAGVVKSNKAEREMLIQVLVYCGILQPRSRPGYFTGFVPYNRRLPPLDDRTFWHYPINWWRGEDGVNREALKFYFPDV